MSALGRNAPAHGGDASGRAARARCAHLRALAISACAAVAVALAVPAGAAAASGVTISPLPGTPDATPQTQISILGAAPSNIASVSVTGSESGVHAGHIEDYKSAEGASFLPEVPFTEGEEVKVLVDLNEGGPLEDSFSVAHLGPAEALLHNTGEKPEDQEHYVTEPELRPPKVKVTTADPSLEGDIFTDPLPAPEIHPGESELLKFEPVGPNGLMILNPEGKILWWHQFTEEVGSVLEPVTYEGEPALSWWQGKVTQNAFGLGEGVIANSAYEPIAHIKAGNGLQADIHEMYVTPAGQAYIIAVEPVCVPECSKEHVPVFDDEIQEIDIKTGLVMWSWHSMGHVPDSESEIEPTDGVWDPYHTNSIQALPDHRLLVSMRDTSGVYELEQDSGQILWQISPKKSSFKLGKEVEFHFQHDARLEGKKLNFLTLFDDEAGPPLYGPSRGLILKLGTKTVRLVHQYIKEATVALAEGSMQVLPHREAVVGFGATQYFAEYSKNGEKHKRGRLLFEAELPQGDGTYRVMRFPWDGRPDTKPLAAAVRENISEVSVYASWNGATEVATWEVLAGESEGTLAPVTSAPWSNFETKITVSSEDKVFEVKALNSEGKVLSRSQPVEEG